MPSRCGQQSRLMYPLELQTTPRTEKITSRGPSVAPAFSPQKFLTRKSSLWLFPAPLHTRTSHTETHNGASNLPENKKFKQMQYWQTLSNDSSANRPTKGEEKQNKTILTHKKLNANFYQNIKTFILLISLLTRKWKTNFIYYIFTHIYEKQEFFFFFKSH